MSSKQTLYPCGSCIMRYGMDDINSVNDCCYNTCSQFVQGSQQDIINSECGAQCAKCMDQMNICRGKTPCKYKIEVPVISIAPKVFNKCLIDFNQDKDRALECCVNKSANHKQIETCIDAYNALQKSVHEPFEPPYQTDNILLVGAIVLFVCLCLTKSG